MKKYRIILTILTVLSVSVLHAQKFGVRAGLNFNTIKGPTEASEKLEYNSGFHFGINYSYLFTDIFSVRAEIGYIQNGYKQQYNGKSFYIIRTKDNTTFEKGDLQLELKNSLGYVSIPVVANLKVSNKIEVHGGIYFNILASPIAQGKLRFESYENAEGIAFRQSLTYNYSTDKIGYAKGGNLGEGIGIYVDEKVVTLPQFAGAYYQYAEDLGKLIRGVDFGITGGLDYFINKGFYIGLSVDYGLTDITNDKANYRLSELSESNEFIFDKHHDPNFGAKVSIGFRF